MSSASVSSSFARSAWSTSWPSEPLSRQRARRNRIAARAQFPIELARHLDGLLQHRVAGAHLAPVAAHRVVGVQQRQRSQQHREEDDVAGGLEGFGSAEVVHGRMRVAHPVQVAGDRNVHAGHALARHHVGRAPRLGPRQDTLLHTLDHAA